MTSTSRRPGRSWKKILLWLIGIAVVAFVLIQFIPYGRSSHTNPAATNPFQWTDPQAEAIARESCYDCHSNETRWWWATNVAPFSWLVQRDVDRGRGRMNFSGWDGRPSVDEIREAIDGRMPPFRYTLIHPGAKLTNAEKQTLLQGFQASVDASGGSSTGGGSTSTPTPSTTSGAATDAVSIIDKRCSICHPADRALAFRTSNTPEAQALIDNMIRRGAWVTAEERQALVRYFTQQ